MKLKLLIAVPIFLLLVFVANWGYGNVVSKKLDKQLRYKMEANLCPVKFGYEKLKVNPLFSEIVFYNVSMANAGMDVESEKVVVNISYKDAMVLSQNAVVEEINPFAIGFENSIVRVGNERVFVETFFVDYDGYLTRTEVEQMEKQFPQNKQQVYCHVKNVRVGELSGFKDIDFLINKKGNVIDEVNFDLVFDPDKKHLKLSDVVVDNNIIIAEGKMKLEYEGNGLIDFSLKHIAFDLASSNGSNKIEWGNAETTGLFSVKKVRYNCTGELMRNEFNIWSFANLDKLKTKLVVKDFKIDYRGMAKKNIESKVSMLGVDVNDISVDNFNFNVDVENGLAVIRKTELESQLVDANLEANIEINQQYLHKSDINSFKLVITDLDPHLDSKIAELSSAFNVSIPRVDGKIVLELTGTVGKPHIKGIN